MKIYKIENWHLLKIDLTEKEIAEYKKKYMHYEVDDLLIFNFDYNIVKPYVINILKKKKFLDDYNKASIFVVSIIMFIWFMLNFYFVSSIKNEVIKLQPKTEEKKEVKVFNPISGVISPSTWTINTKNWTWTNKKMK